jgi:hypothetical protein
MTAPRDKADLMWQETFDAWHAAAYSIEGAMSRADDAVARSRPRPRPQPQPDRPTCDRTGTVSVTCIAPPSGTCACAWWPR